MAGPISQQETNLERDLQQRVRSSLALSNFLTLKRLSVEVSDGSVRLQGIVGTYYAKQLAQEYARRVSGVQRVINQIQVEVGLDSNQHFDPPTEILWTIPVERSAS